MNNYEPLTRVFEEIIAGWGIPGLGVGIVQDGRVVYAQGFGVQSLETRSPVTTDSLFCVASVSKCFVACAVMQLVEAGKIALDAPLVEYLPDFKMADDRYRQITIRQILSHTSGMPDMDESEYDELVAHPETDEGAPERYVRALSDQTLVDAPGARFWYSNIAYNVLGYLIARISGQIFENYMKQNILLPAGMPDSTFFYPEVPYERLALPHLRIPQMIVNPIYPYHRADAPASFLHSSVIEMLNWASTCLAGGEYNGRRILWPATYDLMWTPVARRGYPPFYEAGGLGWTLGHYEGVKTVSHGGGGFGWTDFLVLLPERNRAAVILCNEESSARERTIEAVVRAMLGFTPEAGKVSWMVPITRALEEGGSQAALDCYAALKAEDNQAYYFDPDELVDLTYQLHSVKQIELAIDVLKLNLHAFPEHARTRQALARFYEEKSKGE